MSYNKRTLSQVLIALLILTLPSISIAVAPSPEFIEKVEKGEISISQRNAIMNRLQEFSAEGGCAAVKDKDGNIRNFSTSTGVDTLRLLVLMVDFSDHQFDGTSNGQVADVLPEEYQVQLFSDRESDTVLNPTGSMTDYYFENSYGNLKVQGDVFGWYRMPQSYNYYVLNNTDGGITRSKEYAMDAFNLALSSGEIDFSRYDMDNDGNCDGLLIIHAGVGAETGGYGIWSHKFQFNKAVLVGGVLFKHYVVGPEESGGDISTIGVITHEFGHYLGLPDLYDLDTENQPGSDGLGLWDLMASGNYNNFGRSPSHFSAWSKVELGFVTPINLFGNLSQVQFPAVEHTPFVYRLQNFGAAHQEFWLIENRQRTGFDTGLPRGGLCIYHIDSAVVTDPSWNPKDGVNFNPDRYMVSMEQADGKEDLSYTDNNDGDFGDVFPGASGNREFHNFSEPNSKTNYDEIDETGEEVTQIGLWNISDTDSIMYADLDVEFSRPWVVLDTFTVEAFKNGTTDDIINAKDTVKLFFGAKNLMKPTFNAQVEVSTNNTDISFINETAFLASFFNEGLKTSEPAMFIMPDSIQPTIDSFYVTITSDSTNGGSSVNYSETFGFELQLGGAEILLVDDDRGQSYQEAYSEALSRLKMPHKIWNVALTGSPTAEDLAAYSIVFWHTGDTGTAAYFEVAEINAMQGYFDGGGSLFLSSISGFNESNLLHTSFRTNYLNCVLEGSALRLPVISGDSTNTLFEGISLIYDD